jgi:hypothetical protein
MRLKMDGIFQHDIHQRAGRRRRENRAAKAVVHEFRQISDVVDVSVRNDDRFNLFRLDRKRDAVERRNVGRTLKETAVDEYVAPVVREQMFAPRHGSGGADKR